LDAKNPLLSDPEILKEEIHRLSKEVEIIGISEFFALSKRNTETLHVVFGSLYLL
jgi:hypothetical protein